jgi:hypothetical protein
VQCKKKKKKKKKKSGVYLASFNYYRN